MSGRPEPRPRRVLFVNRFYWPDHSATAQILTDLAGDLAARGWPIIVITSRLRYDGGELLPPRAMHAGVTIERVATTRFGRGNLAGRAIDYASFYLTASFAVARMIRRGDIVVAKNPSEQNSEVIKRVGRINERGNYFLVGDNSEDSNDSRHFGAVTKEYIRGKIVARLSE